MQERNTCPWAGLPSDMCSPEATELKVNYLSDDHIRWHIEEEVRVGTLVDNGDGTVSLKEEAVA